MLAKCFKSMKKKVSLIFFFISWISLSFADPGSINSKLESLSERLVTFECTIASYQKVKSEKLFNIFNPPDQSSLDQVVSDLNTQAEQFWTKFTEVQQEIDRSDLETEKRLDSIKKLFFDHIRRYFTIRAEILKRYDSMEQSENLIRTQLADLEIMNRVNTGGHEISIASNRLDVANEAYFFAQERYKEVRHLEKSLQEVSELFLASSIWVDRQREVVDRIQNRIENAKDNVNDAQVELTDAVRIKKRKSNCNIF
jgi:t-SNARE complex subunit (syntaxin)